MKRKLDITTGKIAEWVQIDRQRKIRAERRYQLFDRVRAVFVFLFVATVLMFAFNHHVEIQSMASAKLHQALNHVTAPDRLRQNAVNYEKQVDDVAK